MKRASNREPWRRPASAALTLQEAVASSFALDRDGVVARLGGFSDAEWTDAMRWLDVSGTALYLADHLRQFGISRVLPPQIEEALAGRLRRNRLRMQSLLEETSTLCSWFDGAGMPYALLKGMTLAPDSVPDSALRSQVDLDFLVAAEQRDLAVHYVRRLGYRLQVQCGGDLEFRAPGVELPSLASMYSAGAPRALELHLLESGGMTGLLARRVRRSIQGVEVYALAPADILVQQAIHLLKHLCGEFTRVSWVLEFQRHVVTRQHDFQFWREVAELAYEAENGNLAMAISFWLVRDLFGHVPVELPPQWEAGALPKSVRVWLELYARQIVLTDPRPTKLYALLRNEIPYPAEEKRATSKILFPYRIPMRVMDRMPSESVRQRLQRSAIEWRFFITRLRFHLREGIRFGIEASRFKRVVARVRQ